MAAGRGTAEVEASGRRSPRATFECCDLLLDLSNDRQIESGVDDQMELVASSAAPVKVKHSPCRIALSIIEPLIAPPPGQGRMDRSHYHYQPTWTSQLEARFPGCLHSAHREYCVFSLPLSRFGSKCMKHHLPITAPQKSKATSPVVIPYHCARHRG